MFAFTKIGMGIQGAIKNHKNKKRTTAVFRGLESLESRELLSVTTAPMGPRAARTARHAHAERHDDVVVSIAHSVGPAISTSQVSVYDGTELLINGTSGNDIITVTRHASTYTVTNGTSSTSITGTFSSLCIQGDGGNDSITLDASVTANATIYGGAGNDTITAGSGNESIYAGGGVNVINCGSGNDTVVTIGSTGDRITAGLGNDSFWMDANARETVTGETRAQIKAGAVHQIGSFANFNNGSQITPINNVLNGRALPEPAVTDSGITYTNFAGDPLFSDAGPSPDDIQQGYVGDCYFLSTLASIAKVDPTKIRNSIVSLGDGPYAVQFFNGNTPVYERVDAQLPTWGRGGPLAYANTGAQNSLWVGLVEKAFAEFRTGIADYNNINSGWMSEVYSDFDAPSTTIWSASSATSLFNQVQTLLASGDSVTMAINTPQDGALLIGDHAYSVDHVSDVNGQMTITLRNPWGIVGVGNGPANGGYVTITAQQALDSFSAVMAAAI